MHKRPAGWNAASSSQKFAAACAILLVAALHVVAARHLPVGALNDDAANILLARSLAHGRYAFPGGLGAPAGFLPAFPAFLVIPAGLVAPHWGLLRAIPLAFAALALFLTWRLARRFLGEAAAGACVLLVALNPLLVGLDGLVMPYMPSLALSLALVDGVGSISTRRSWLLLTLGAALAPLLRPQGAVLIAALGLALWHRHGLRKAGAFVFAALLPALLWTWHIRRGAAVAQDYTGIWMANLALLGWRGAMLRNGSDILLKMLGQGFIIVPALPRAGQFALALGTLALALAGAFRILKKGDDARGFVLAAYTAGVFFLHMTWVVVGNRYVIAVVPFLWILIVAALAPFLKKRIVLAWTLLGVFALLPLGSDLAYALEGLDHDAQFEPRTMSWIRENVPASSRLESTKDYTVALLTGHPCSPQRFVARGGDWLAYAREEKIDFLHLQLPLPDDAFPLAARSPAYQPTFAHWLGAQKEATRVFLDSEEGAVVFRLNR